MLHVVNNNLFDFQTEAGTSKYGDYFKTKVFPNVPQKETEVNPRLLTIVSASKNYNDYPMLLLSSGTKESGINVLLKSFENNKYDMQLYLVAFPFNGLADAIPKSNMYRIHRGYLYTSKTRTVKFGDSTYKKVLYLLVEPNVKMFDPNNAHHTDSIELEFVSYNIENVENSDSKRTVKTTVTLTMYPKTATKPYDIDWITEEVDPIDKESLKDIDIFPLYVRKDQIPASEEDISKVISKIKPKQQPKNKNNNSSNSVKHEKQSNEIIEKLGYRTPKNNNKKSKK